MRKILTEVLPYLNIPMTEELSEKEQEELAELRANSVTTQEGIIAEDADNAEGDQDTAEQASGENSGQTEENTGL